MQMLHTLDCSDMDLEAKWALVQKHTADKADFRFALQRPLCSDIVCLIMILLVYYININGFNAAAST